MNHWCGVGRLTKDPETRYTGEGKAIAKFTVAIDDGFGENKKTNFIPVVAFGKTAESCEKYISKGSRVGVTGRIQTGSYEKDDGTRVYTTDIIADRVEFLESTARSTAPTEEKPSIGFKVPEGFAVLDEDDDCPF